MNLAVQMFLNNSTWSTTALQQSFKRKFLSSVGQEFSIEACQQLPAKSSAFSSLPLNRKNCTSSVLGANHHQTSQDFSLAFWEQTGAAQLQLHIPHYPSPLEEDQRPAFLSDNQTQCMSPLKHRLWDFTVLPSPINWLLSLTKLLNTCSVS